MKKEMFEIQKFGFSFVDKTCSKNDLLEAWGSILKEKEFLNIALLNTYNMISYVVTLLFKKGLHLHVLIKSHNAITHYVLKENVSVLI